MTAARIDGKAIATALKLRIANDVGTFQLQHGRPPGLVVVLVGQDPASEVYVRAKAKQARATGLQSRQLVLPTETSEMRLVEIIESLNRDTSIDGILLQLPLPAHINPFRVLETIDPAKDVDGFHPYNVGRLAVGQPAIAPCTPLGVLHLIKHVVHALAGLDVLVIGRSNIVGKPLGTLLGDAGCTVTGAQLQTRNLSDICRRADIVVSAAGSPGLVRGDWVKPGAIVIDVGINRVDDGHGGYSLVGDVAFDEASERASHITPVPGGVGPMTIAYLLMNTMSAAWSRATLRGSPAGVNQFQLKTLGRLSGTARSS
ncbi:bifunctional methylenetetrahydrofolate dehydrogenase/methenyltetrahydrofolate cyclohydrolase FolD [Bradyrhizobium embrapense]|uniref:bifunctional methylenetetrahydrofolate dehydrogenase/methenyltetrahydrofolate cyclohydrolase FolD n=1 Tax=Bradyrhizobium embrapense TaxID=630921 RepID=UPI00067A929D|nr:bifunctional methylenetetrahydrofolate dehydrogenase/methenyltetrahydrofolate cyclohydrolase FolD [Bradyrhizobium embrapense]